jgi:hypothetical protein
MQTKPRYNFTMKKSLILATLLSLILLNSCSWHENYEKSVHSWQGADQSAVYRAWGYPKKIATLPNGNKVLMYCDIKIDSTTNKTTPNKSMNTMQASAAQPLNQTWRQNKAQPRPYECSLSPEPYPENYHVCTTLFELNLEGKVVNTNFHGNNCYATESFMNEHTYNGK